MSELSAAELPKKFISVNGRKMAYAEMGKGDPIVFLHGNPTSSYLWRNIMPHLADQGRCIAPDLIGMGDSEKLPASEPDRYRFHRHSEFLDGFLDAVGAKARVTLVLHDWGSALGFHWARRHAERVLGIAYMEAIVRPVSWSGWPEAARPIFEALRSAPGEDMILERNLFVETILPGSILRKLSEAEMAAYRRPYLEAGEGRQPMLTWPREIPIDGIPADVHRAVQEYADFLSKSPLPKLFVNADPGAILTGHARAFCRTWPNQEEVTVKGNHFIQEDSPHEIGEAVAAWRRRIMAR